MKRITELIPAQPAASVRLGMTTTGQLARSTSCGATNPERTDANRPGVKVTVPTVKMTDVPASAKPAPGATPAAK